MVKKEKKEKASKQEKKEKKEREKREKKEKKEHHHKEKADHKAHKKKPVKKKAAKKKDGGKKGKEEKDLLKTLADPPEDAGFVKVTVGSDIRPAKKPLDDGQLWHFVKGLPLVADTTLQVFIDPNADLEEKGGYLPAQYGYMAFEGTYESAKAVELLNGRRIFGADVDVKEIERDEYMAAQEEVRMMIWWNRYHPPEEDDEAPGEDAKHHLNIFAGYPGGLLPIKPKGQREISLKYELIGPTDGEPIVFTPSQFQTMQDIQPIAHALCRRRTGLRGLLWDCRNTGGSSLSYDQGRDEKTSELLQRVSDLRLFLVKMEMLPVVLCGDCEGSCLSMLFAVMFPFDVKGLILMNPVTADHHAGAFYAQSLYEKYVCIAKAAGMRAIIRTDHFAEMIKLNPTRQDEILALDVGQFTTTMRAFAAAARSYTLKTHTVYGIPDEKVKRIHCPTLIAFTLKPAEAAANPFCTQAAAEKLAKLVVPNNDSSKYFSSCIEHEWVQNIATWAKIWTKSTTVDGAASGSNCYPLVRHVRREWREFKRLEKLALQRAREKEETVVMGEEEAAMRGWMEAERERLLQEEQDREMDENYRMGQEEWAQREPERIAAAEAAIAEAAAEAARHCTPKTRAVLRRHWQGVEAAVQREAAMRIQARIRGRNGRMSRKQKAGSQEKAGEGDEVPLDAMDRTAGGEAAVEEAPVLA
jgi:pimeloyl-ACP methyl ester carboxylesterase